MALMLLAGVTVAQAETITLQFWGGVQPEYGYEKLVENFNDLVSYDVRVQVSSSAPFLPCGSSSVGRAQPCQG